MLVGITTGSLTALLLNLLAIRALRDVWEVGPHPSAGAMYWVCLFLPLVSGIAVATAIGLLHRPARPAAMAFLTTYVVVGAGMVALQNFLDTFADHM
ncbi:hypothetical protein DEU38_117122 [Rhodococcus sp. AG1013]|uniref:hypothetical protein n=1 Tax=Rhodococcus sp. AG1013 TaxID=2183996 RepID=UPI000E0C500C|nr:hypothetical protein [Rhodococcus sp. AG1013]RDI20010.1 hypothetical protein DEU38_117122 [Rhodococcus sp. AG1013]